MRRPFTVRDVRVDKNFRELEKALTGIQILTLPVYVNNAAAIAGGLVTGQLYRTSADPDTVCIVH